MKRLAELLGDLAEAPHSAARQRRLVNYFRSGEEDLGWTLAWVTNALKPPRQTPAKLRAMAEARVDPELFRLSASAIGDISETVALIWPGKGDLSVASVASVATIDLPVTEFLDQLDAEARVATIRLITGRKVKGAKPREVHHALAEVFNADPDLIAGAMIEEAPPYPRLCAWLKGEGPAPNWAPPRPPALPRLDQAPEGSFQAFDLPPGEPVAVEAGRAFSSDGGEVKLTVDAEDGWGFCHGGLVTSPTAAAPVTDPQIAHKAGAPLLIRFAETAEWAIWPPEARTIICPVTFVEIGRAVNITLGVLMAGEAAPLIKLPAPDAAKVSTFARKAVIEKFGPVRQVGPGLWAEIAYEAVLPAPRRKIGVTLEGAQVKRLIWDDGPATPDLSDIS